MKNMKEIYKNLEFVYIKEENDAALEIYNMAKNQFPDDPLTVAMTMYVYGKRVADQDRESLELNELLDKINKSAVLMDEMMSNYFNRLDPGDSEDSAAIALHFKTEGLKASMAEDYVHEIRNRILYLMERSHNSKLHERF